jgi:hypothetical protein
VVVGLGGEFPGPQGKNEETIAARLGTATSYKLSPDWIRLIDNSRWFGYKEKIKLRLPSALLDFAPSTRREKQRAIIF